MKSENKEFEAHYHKAHHITEELLSTYYNNQCVKDNEEICEFFQENRFSDALIERLSSAEIHREFYDYLAHEEKEENIALLLDQIRTKAKQKKRRIFWYQIAASIAVIIAVSILLIRQQEESSGKYLYSNTLSEQYIRPTLILENDQSLVLPDSNEVIVSENYGVEKSGNNTLRYSSGRSVGIIPYNKLIVPRQYTYTVCFDDGTEVTLNAGSILRYPVNFAGDVREVELSGEAFFKVAKSEKPFIVRMGEEYITVYGTQFNVYTRDSNSLEIVLVEGSIGFKTEGKEEVRMQPSQMLICDTGMKNIELTWVDPEDYIMWIENMFVFKSQTLERILTELSVWYGINVISEQDLKKIKLTLMTSKNNSLEDIFSFITEITGIHLIKTGNMEYKAE